MRDIRVVVTLALILLPTPALQSQEATSPDGPKVSLVLPEGIASESVQINYHMTGPFGGYGMWVKPEKDRTSYTIEASVERQPAEDVKVIAWLPGCEIVAFDIRVDGPAMERRLECKALSSLEFNGQIFPPALIKQGAAEVEADYFAEWSHRFFGICDGPIFMVRVGKTEPEIDGNFHIQLPDFANQSSANDAEFRFLLRDKHTGNIIAFLKPIDSGEKTDDVKMLHEYPTVVRFAAEQR